eukprot:comp18044_c0_seq1/m.31532 comp18044_c0_seq1/g.31532  ORF comp18044_c0_seq1/g.31532 comp18044_c0_seq1/m.31532 type:complete len:435 (+) comp18044_c0_seq1:3-1307(+)
MWVTLFEKAYAKFHGNYAALAGGYCKLAITDLTSSYGEDISLAQKTDQASKDALWDYAMQHYKSDSLIGISSKPKSDPCWAFTKEAADGNSVAPNGLVVGHAFAILEVINFVDDDKKTHKILRVRNPWGAGEWNGKWSDKDNIWKTKPHYLKKLKHSIGDDGVFLIEWSDLFKFFYGINFSIPYNNWSFKQIRYFGKKSTAAIEHQYVFEISQTYTPVHVRIHRFDPRQATRGNEYKRTYATLAICSTTKELSKSTGTRTGLLSQTGSWDYVFGINTNLSNGFYRVFFKDSAAGPHCIEILCPSTATFKIWAVGTTAADSGASSSDESYIGRSASDYEASSAPSEGSDYDDYDDDDDLYGGDDNDDLSGSDVDGPGADFSDDLYEDNLGDDDEYIEDLVDPNNKKYDISKDGMQIQVQRRKQRKWGIQKDKLVF